VDRFFPPRYEETPQSVLRGCSSVSCYCILLMEHVLYLLVCVIGRIIKRAVSPWLPLSFVFRESHHVLHDIASFKLIAIHRLPCRPRPIHRPAS
jgi:hypothetical protein